MIPLPQPEVAKWKSLTLAATVHLLLIAALFFGVQWKSQVPSSVEVEVWRAVPAPAVKPEPKMEPKPEPKAEPKPEVKPEPKPPVKADIVVKEEKKPKELPKKEEPKKPEPKKKNRSARSLTGKRAGARTEAARPAENRSGTTCPCRSRVAQSRPDQGRTGRRRAQSWTGDLYWQNRWKDPRQHRSAASYPGQSGSHFRGNAAAVR